MRMEFIIGIGNIPLQKDTVSPMTILSDPSASGMNALSLGLDLNNYLVRNNLAWMDVSSMRKIVLKDQFTQHPIHHYRTSIGI